MNSRFAAPSFKADDIRWVERILDATFEDERRTILLSNESFDVQACPGSGKTTLLVAKLALLARQWTARRQGICVLSHTNVARAEIETKLGATVEGARLLGYPHFIGTIHSFINEFLAFPWLRSQGKTVRQIDDDKLKTLLHGLIRTDPAYKTLASVLRQRQSGAENLLRQLRFEGPNLELGFPNSKPPFGKDKPSYAQLESLKQRLATEGYYRHDDMFAIAEQLLARVPSTASALRTRFPVVFIDEAQDNSDLQNSILNKIFPKELCQIRQRFGDSDQAIFTDKNNPSSGDVFPEALHRTMHRSKRFGDWIAKRARSTSSSGINLVGDGPTRCPGISTSSKIKLKHTLFLFEDDAYNRRPLEEFGDLLIETFPAEALRRGVFKAIGWAHKVKDEAKHRPSGLPDYWDKYVPELSPREPRPSTFADHLHLAIRHRRETGELSPAITQAAKGLLVLVELCGAAPARNNNSPTQKLRELVSNNTDAAQKLDKLLWKWCIDDTELTEASWGQYQLALKTLVEGLLSKPIPPDAIQFLQWSQRFHSGPAFPATARNIYTHQRGDTTVSIGLGTIHSAKGETHTATLILDTYSHLQRFHIDKDIRVLADHSGTALKDGMRLLYVAMTRPSHLLCVATRVSFVDGNPKTSEDIKSLKQMGWRVRLVNRIGAEDI